MNIQGKLFLALAILSGMPPQMSACDREAAKIIVATGGMGAAFLLLSSCYAIKKFSPSGNNELSKLGEAAALGFGSGVVVGGSLAMIARATTYTPKLSAQEVVKPVAMGLAGLFVAQAVVGEIGRLSYFWGSQKYRSSWRRKSQARNGAQVVIGVCEKISGNNFAGRTYYTNSSMSGAFLLGAGALVYTAYQRYTNDNVGYWGRLLQCLPFIR